MCSASGSPHDSVRAQLGKGKFVVCAACHGADGKGNTLIGAPNLTDNIWLHGYGEDFIVGMINHGKTNQMPAQKDRYDATQIKMLAAYVWGFSHGGLSAQAKR
jgi:cytochrome c oxidase cbb3-type subunit 3